MSGGEDCGVSVQALSPEVMNAEKRSDSGPHPGHLGSVITRGDGGGAREGSSLRLEWNQLDAAPGLGEAQTESFRPATRPHTLQAVSLQSSLCSSLVAPLL